MIIETKWLVQVIFTYLKDKAEDETNRRNYEEFRKRVLRSMSSAKPKDFDDRQRSFTHVCKKPGEVLEYFYVLNPMPSEDILDDATVTITRSKRGIRSANFMNRKENVKKLANKTMPMMKEVKINEFEEVQRSKKR